MIIFPDVEMEVFDIQDERPSDGEFVFVVLKKETAPTVTSTSFGYTYKSGNDPFSLIRICRIKIYKSERIKFFDSTGLRHETHSADDIACWGRIKK